MKKIINVILIVFSLTACAQNNRNDMGIEKRTDLIMEKVKKYDYEPMYRLKVASHLTYEILINDVPAAIRFSPNMGTIWYPINRVLLKEGNQNISIKVYPRYEDRNTQKDFLEIDYGFELTIEQTAWVNGSLEEPVNILNYQLPKNDENNVPIDYSSLNFYEINLSFETKTPYNLAGWTNGNEFSKKDSLSLKEKLSNIYNEIILDYKNKKISKILKREFNRDKEIAQYDYLSKNSLLKETNDFVKSFDEFEEEYEPLENYKLVFYGNNKIIGLVRTDTRFRGKSAFIGVSKDNLDRIVYSYYDLLFYSPKGSDSLEIIR
jgi:hypothetical protein